MYTITITKENLMPSNLGMIDINLLDLEQVKDLFQAAFDLLQKKDKEIRKLKEEVQRLEWYLKESKKGL